MVARPAEGLGIGARLKGGRERAGLTIIQAAERLHVDPRAIEALENDRFEELGASVYVRGHIRHYAELVGEPAAELLELYAASAHAARKPDLTRVPKGESPGGASRVLLVPAVVVVVAVGLIGTIGWVAGTMNAASRPQRRNVQPTPPAAGATPSTDEGSISAPSGPTPVSAPALAQDSAPRQRVPVTQETVSSAAGSTTLLPPTRAHAAAVGAPSAPVAAPAAVVAAPGTQAPAPRGIGVQRARTSALRLHFAEDSWAEVYDAHGERLFYDVGSADSTRTVSGSPPLRIVLGNPTGVSLELDGHPVTIPDGAERDVSIDFRVMRSGRVAPSHLASAGAHTAATGAAAGTRTP